MVAVLANVLSTAAEPSRARAGTIGVIHPYAIVHRFDQGWKQVCLACGKLHSKANAGLLSQRPGVGHPPLRKIAGHHEVAD